MDLLNLCIQGVSGVLGGNAVGGLDKQLSQGIGGNSLLGILGGALAGQVMNHLGVGLGALDALTLLANVASGTIGGALLTFFVGAFRVLITR